MGINAKRGVVVETYSHLFIGWPYWSDAGCGLATHCRRFTNALQIRARLRTNCRLLDKAFSSPQHPDTRL